MTQPSSSWFSSPIGRVRAAGLLEGSSFLALLAIAMPLKYLADMPMPVRVVGWVHGILFLIFCAALLSAHRHGSFSFGRLVMLFIAALLPFGPFVMDRGLREQQG